MQAWFDTKEETIADYNERISDGIHVLYPQEKILQQILGLKTEELEQGKIYYLDYNSNVQIVGRYKDSDATNHYFYDLCHYWNDSEMFRFNKEYCVKSGIENLRRASKAEIYNLVRNEIENNCL
jgi:hypothetical protein